MSGSSKSKNIKHRKEAQDAKRSKLFAKFTKALRVAVQAGGDDPEKNPQLRQILQDAKRANMPKDNLERAIAKAAGGTESDIQLQFECYASGGVAIFIECSTDNTNRTVAHIRAQLRRHNAEIAKVGALQHIFAPRGVLQFAAENVEEETLLGLLIDLDLEEPTEREGTHTLTCEVVRLREVKESLEAAAIEVHSACPARIIQLTQAIPQPAYDKLCTWLTELEDNDDVEAVYHNATPLPATGQ